MDIMISATALDGLLNDPAQECVIFDCRFSLADFELGHRQYLEGHIPGALHLDMEQQMAGAKSTHGGRHPLPGAQEFTASMQQMGVNDTTLIIAYDENRLAGAARLWWLLQHFGHRRIRILDGGLPAWRAAGLPLSRDIPSPRQGNFQARPVAEQTRDYDWLSAHLEDARLQLIDSREAPRYQGLEEPIDPLAGHIPGALNYPWQEVTDADGFARPAPEQQARWRDLDPDKETLVYCGSGVTACVNLLSLTLAGYDNARLYPGSWSDWCTYSDSLKRSSTTP